ncbi:hypothetical protein [Pseudorhodoferax sp. Leaf274]|uniref:hypothetical protein n=1 Tax=Pseudorhodoferax sp. Leaf274 TaxID=1736318 RepID=UPI0007039855|nr:hypothetical protein [Pseudorhodoferax sp. Leaf274]KQP36125.1 hypothetical protein ASF44_16280 [Pseudorhodoferax sp. Leaf274]
MTERYALFAGDEFYPNGGFEDFIAYGGLDELKAMLPRLAKKDWAHIADLKERRVVLVMAINKYNRTDADEWQEADEWSQPLGLEGDGFAAKGE